MCALAVCTRFFSAVRPAGNLIGMSVRTEAYGMRWPDFARAAGRWLRLLGAGCVLGLAPVLAAAGTPDFPRGTEIVRIAYTEFPPFTYRNELGQPAGSLIELTRQVAIEAGYRPEFVNLPVSRINLYLRNGKVDLSVGLSGVPVLKNDVLESVITPSVVQLSAWYTEGTPALTHFDDFQGKAVIVISGYTYGGLLEHLSRLPGVRITEAPHHRSAVDMLRRGRGDYVLDYRQPVRQVLEETDSIPVYESEVRTRDVAWLFSLARRDATRLRNAFDNAYLRLVARGEVVPVMHRGQTFRLPGVYDLHYWPESSEP